MVNEIPPGRRSSTDDNELSAGPPEAEQSSVALQTPDPSASSLASAHNSAVLGINQAERNGALDVPSFTIPDADMVNMMDAPHLEFLSPHSLGSPMWNLPFFYASSPQPLTSLVTEALDTSQTFPGYVYGNSTLGEGHSDTNETD